jgi:hypothetical protein
VNDDIQPPQGLQNSVVAQRESLGRLLHAPLLRLATECSHVWHDRAALDAALKRALDYIPHVKFIYAMDTSAVQISATASREGPAGGDFGRDRSQRPYMREAVPADGFLLSHAYISLRARRPSFTAIQLVRGALWEVLGFVGADFDLRDLPLSGELYAEPRRWLQLRGDPSIRGTVFHQTRTESELDRHLDTVTSVLTSLMADHGVYHVILHFSSSRAVIWVLDDPFRYRLLDIRALTDPDICLAYPRRPYPADALVRPEQVRVVLERFRSLRLMDEMFYLRSGTLNVFNGLVGLTFSCDGSHYIPCDEFLGLEANFWVTGTRPKEVT